REIAEPEMLEQAQAMVELGHDPLLHLRQPDAERAGPLARPRHGERGDVRDAALADADRKRLRAQPGAAARGARRLVVGRRSAEAPASRTCAEALTESEEARVGVRQTGAAARAGAARRVELLDAAGGDDD